MNMQAESHPLRQFYRNITFDTLKERHDNFSFNKAIRTKQKLNDTIHFQRILDNPNDPKIVIFKKTQQEIDNGQFGDTYRNEKYQGNREDIASFRDF